MENIVHSILDLIYYLFSFFRKGYNLNLDERHGYVVENTVDECYWIHGSSLGEARMSLVLLDLILSIKSDIRIVLTTSTPSGRDYLLKNITNKNVACYYLPYDTHWAVTRFLSKIKPRCLFLIETEMWPNLLKLTHLFGAKVYVVSGRLGYITINLYKFIFKFWSLFNYINGVFAKSEKDALAFESFGISNVVSLGNLKWCLPLCPQKTHFKKRNNLTLLCASVQKKEVVFFSSLWQKKKLNLSIIIAPRRIENLKFYLSLFSGAKTVLESQYDGHSDFDIMIVDSFGVLGSCYDIADIVFIGGSLVNHGGQNPLEAMSYAKPVIMGPYTYNFTDIVDVMQQDGVLTLVDNLDSLLKYLTLLDKDRALLSELGQKSYSLVNKMSNDIKNQYYLVLDKIISRG